MQDDTPRILKPDEFLAGSDSQARLTSSVSTGNIPNAIQIVDLSNQFAFRKPDRNSRAQATNSDWVLPTLVEQRAIAAGSADYETAADDLDSDLGGCGLRQ